MLMAIITGKGVNLYAQKQPKNKHKIILFVSFLATGGYTIVCLNLYLFKSIVLPWFLPSLIFWLYLTPIFRRKLP
jgi:membrane protein CcdC involved in cytochrome C biogenesis